MSFTYFYNGRDLERRMVRAVETATRSTADLAVDLLKDRVSTPYPPASVPGESPHLRTGAGQDAIHAEHSPETPEESAIILDESGKHMLFLEVGTEHVAPRPWFRVTIEENRKRLADHHATVLRRELGG